MNSSAKIGYGKPPEQHQFKKGVSGNPKGRPKRKEREIGEIVANVINEETSYVEGGKQKIATRQEVSLKALIKQAMSGNIRAAGYIIKLLKDGDGSRTDDIPHLHVTGWLPDFPGQTSEQRNNEARQQAPSIERLKELL